MDKIPVSKVKPVLKEMEQSFNTLEKAFFARIKKEREIVHAVWAMGGKFKNYEKGAMLFTVDPAKVELRPGWTLEGDVLRVQINSPE